MDEDEIISTYLYYGRENFYHAMQEAAIIGLSKFTNHNMYNLYSSIALVIGGRVQEAMRELLPLVKDKETSLAAILALIFVHKKCSVIDNDAVSNLEIKLKEERRSSNYLAMYHAALFVFYCGFVEKASDYIDRSLKLNSEFDKAHALKGWISLHSQSMSYEAIRQHFEKSLQLNKSLDSYLGLVKLQVMRKEYEAAITKLNKVIVNYPNSVIPLIEKMYIQLAKWDWDQSLDTSLRILQMSKDNLQAYIVKIVVMLCRDGDYDKGSKTIKELSAHIEKSESKNCRIFIQTAQLFSRICGRSKIILNETFKLAEHAMQINSADLDVVIELGYQSLLCEKVNEASRFFQSATKLDNSSIEALCGLTLCQLLESGPSDQVCQQIDFLMEIHGIENILPLLNYLSAKVVKNDSEKALSLLNKSYETHFKALHNLPFGIDYLNKLNPDFLLQLAKEFLVHSPKKSAVKDDVSQSTNMHKSLKQASKLLLAIVQACPGLVEALFQLSRVYFLSGDLLEANNTLQKILEELDPTFADAHLLRAQINIQQMSYNKAAQSLEICLSYNFNVREKPLYHLLMGIVQKQEGHLADSFKSFEKAMELASVKQSNKSNLSSVDEVTLYLELADAHMESNQPLESLRILQEATDEFKNSSEFGRILIANADVVIKTGDIQQALNLLGKILPDQEYYLQAKTKAASIYLHHLNDRQAFAQCFRELVENCPGPDSFIMLGDAYMSIQEPDHAIEAYAQAITQNPKDSALASKMGRALVKTHQYDKAVQYYQEAVANCQNANFKLDMSELYAKLKQYDNAEKILLDELENNKNAHDDIAVLQMRTKQLLLLSRVKEKSGNLTGSLACLKEAKDNQLRVTKRISMDRNTSLLAEQQRISSQVCVLMAEHCSHLREANQAIEHYKDALKFQPNNSEILSSLARVYMQINNFDMCEETCGIVLQSEPNHEAASVMMADLAFRKVDFEGACFHFSQLLLAQPLYWTALARLIEVMRRTARLEEAVPFIERAQKNCSRSNGDSGLAYCKALYEWYTGNHNAALRYFNSARCDPEWGQQAIYNMIEICLHPDDDPTNDSAELFDDAEYNGPRTMAIRTAEKLLRELKPRIGGLDNEALNHKLLGNFLLLATKQKANVDKALQEFTTLASQHEYREQVGPILGMSMAHLLQKNTNRAKNQLKRVAKSPWCFEEAEYLERCWLLLADCYIQSSKYDLGSELLKRVLQHNKSCIKAYELSGFIAEKEQNVKLTFANYENAWKFGGRSNPQIGFRLAYSFMKNKRYADALEVSYHILKIHPDYPRVKKDIIEKCQNNLRT